jgi:N-acetylmuramic acid 6-phosphate (MurNAc-6-P) etherase
MIRIVTEIKNCEEKEAERLLEKHNWVIRDAVEA